ncbi:hydrogenase expression/formation protein HypD [Clostridium botulinum B str. Osaka05]|uniref:Hydrogenase expression/formation protein HypD n=1 Tax=Clostridium botulinum B str. Osaka05 TaxID=1407017 RepID=A0A0S6U1Q8_CLOBO|nr:hydrogenase formation protein HypD [Clostridium botulinum]GAE02317.1 hydrogenase expression/formation protein HypD [Clostridium botulinum B str. Osaka05]
MDTNKLMYEIIRKIKDLNIRPLKIMEVCGSHTDIIGKLGLRDVLYPKVKFISGPGCPVCVTDESYINAALELLNKKNVLITTFGDLVRVKGSINSLMDKKTDHNNIKIVYSPLEAIKMAKENKSLEVVFLAVGFETTAPLIALSVKKAKHEKIENISFLLGLKTMKPILEHIFKDKNHDIDGLICPGHVASIKGANYFSFIRDTYNIPAAISGFQPLDILGSIYFIINGNMKNEKTFINLYKTCVKEEGNKIANELIDEVFSPEDSNWRGIGLIKNSALGLKHIYSDYDALKKFNIKIEQHKKSSSCICGEIILGKKSPKECTLFSKECTPRDSKGPCMVSKEGACAIFYKYNKFKF